MEAAHRSLDFLRPIAGAAAFDPAIEATNGRASSFGRQLRNLRCRTAGKQVAMSLAIGCTDAALSLWETGARLPTPRSMGRILTALAEQGVTTAELLMLRSAWRDEYARR